MPSAKNKGSETKAGPVKRMRQRGGEAVSKDEFLKLRAPKGDLIIEIE